MNVYYRRRKAGEERKNLDYVTTTTSHFPNRVLHSKEPAFLVHTEWEQLSGNMMR